MLPVMLLVVTGLLDVARAVWQENTLAYAAREGTRYAIVHGSAATSPVPYCSATCSPAAVLGAVQNAAVGVPSVTVEVSYPDGNNDRNSRVSVNATAPFAPLPSQYLLGGAFTITLRGASALVIQN